MPELTIKAFQQVLEQEAAAGNRFAAHYLEHKAKKRTRKNEPPSVFRDDTPASSYPSGEPQNPVKTEPEPPNEPSKVESFFDPDVDDGIPF